ncbi:glucan biosynthesis protein [Inquilinus sp. CAU 1745]|uniref:glucan biosynthesis protein n=1 Tax=Inquilinus sp. CAU 1745 TaxID=3140369 RepID=UPI00325A6FDF
MKRRELLSTAAAATAVGALYPLLAALPARAQMTGSAAGPAQPFDREWLVAEARRLAEAAYVPPPDTVPQALKDLSWDQYQDIAYEEDESLWAEDDLAFQVRLFHLGLFFLKPVKIHEVVDGQATPIAYSSDLFDYGDNEFDPPLPADLGFAGFRVHFHTDFEFDMAAFLGASYFRAVGGERQYGMSARGLAIDTGLPSGEEFPDFRAFWIERPAPGETTLTVHALLDSPSIAGAFSFDISPGQTTLMDVRTNLFPRAAINQLGIAPLTSMYQFGENDRRVSDDFRPEVHDSDGLSMWRGNGEWMWRPLVNSPVLRANLFMDENPRGFGLLQRDRKFEHYQDDGVYYNKRPNLWVEPLGPWGKGAVQLVEIPTADETFDNIVAFWVPEQEIAPGQEIALDYRLSWGTQVPGNYATAARVIATRIGAGGIPGLDQTSESRKFVIDFKGGDLALLSRETPVEPVITTSRGRISEPAARPIEELGGWRVNFDLVEVEGTEPVDLRLYLKLDETALTETWIYQWTPRRI